MSLSIAVAVTDGGWYEYLYKLNSRHPLEDVNFWRPPTKSGKPLGFNALRRGELFLFNVKDAGGQRKIAGGGIFLSSLCLPCSYAWRILGEHNGAPSLDSMKRSIAERSSSGPSLKEDFSIGCRILAQPIFLPPELWFTPPDWKRGIQSFKAYSTAEEHGLRLWKLYADACDKASQANRSHFEQPQPIRPRPSRGAFRTDVVNVYNKRCAVTQGRTLVVLEPTHIRSPRQQGSHDVSNGLLLRCDLHTLFDNGYATVKAEGYSHRFLVSNRIKQDFGNGREYQGLHGTEILLPKDARYRPNPQNLQWHNDYVFLG